MILELTKVFSSEFDMSNPHAKLFSVHKDEYFSSLPWSLKFEISTFIFVVNCSKLYKDLFDLLVSWVPANGLSLIELVSILKCCEIIKTSNCEN